MRWATFQKMIMLEQSIFGLSWVLASALLPLADPSFTRYAQLLEWQRWLCIVLAFCSARTAGMAFNRLIDHSIDAANPRTQDRVLPSGEASVWQVRGVACLASIGFIASCAALSSYLLAMSLPVLLLIYSYAYTKRFTSLCHFVMGLISGLAPICAWIAITDSISLAPVLMGLALMLSIAAMDIIYALQDYDYDMEVGLHSIPVRLGKRWSVYLARVLHGVMLLSLVLMGLSLQLGASYYFGLLCVGALLVYHHSALRPSQNTWIYGTFFAVNSRVGIAVLLLVGEVLLWGAIS